MRVRASSSKIALRNADILLRRKAGEHPRSIHASLDGTLTLSSVFNLVREARLRGEVFPDIPVAPRKKSYPVRLNGGHHMHIPHSSGSDDYRDPPKRKPLPFETLTDAERDRLRDLAQHNVGLTGIAALLRKQYRTVAGEFDRLGLSRVRAR